MDLFNRRVAARMCLSHISAVERAGLSGLNEGQVVEYEEVSNRGKTVSGESERFNADFYLVWAVHRDRRVARVGGPGCDGFDN